ncbi:MAG: AMP-binding protein [Firmicutes bacterium]|nr:AMP-binding protein [Bacillota bacterium]
MYNLGTVLKRTSERHPHRPALIVPGSKIHCTYLEWNSHVNKLANSLLRLGVTKGDRVSTFLPNSAEIVTVLFATAKIGAVFNPVNCNLSSAELAFILNDIESRVLVYGEPEKKRVERAYAKIKNINCYLYVGEKSPEYAYLYSTLLEKSSDEEPSNQVSENDWYSIMHTSGTTGKPKGVIHWHRDIMDHSMCMISSQGLTHRDKGLSVAPLYHSAELHCFFIPRVHTGAANIILDNQDSRSILQALSNEKITVFFADPTKLKTVLQDVPGPYQLPRLRLVAHGGAPLEQEVALNCREYFNADVIDYYGMTEMGPAISALGPGEQQRNPGPAGKAILNHAIWIVELNGDLPSEPDNTVKPGCKGEIIVRGTGMMQGYYNRPEITARALYGGWYHTGDIGSFDQEGHLWVFDRVDDAIITPPGKTCR